MVNLQQVGVYLPQGFLFNNVSLQINSNDRVGLVGKNGAGKSTLLKLIAGWNKPSEGQIHKSKDLTVGFLTQDIEIDSNQSVLDFLKFSNPALNKITADLDRINHELVSRTDYESDSYLSLLDELAEANDHFQLIDGYQWEEKIISVLSGLGFSTSDLEKPLNKFSGGWKMRAELARILVNQPNILLLDEPTNHLDIISISWLEDYLKTFPGIIVLISHDRLFLDNVTTRTLEISNGTIYDFPYAYSKYKILRAEELERLSEAQKNQAKEIKRTEELIDKFRAKKNKASFAQSLIKKLEKTERIVIEKEATSKMKIRFPLSVQPGKWVLELNNLGKKYDDKDLFHQISITVGRGEKIALLGPNGVGKSTLLKLIMKTIEGEGEVNYGHNVQIAYFAQNQAEKLDKKKTVFETVDQVAVGDIRKDLRSLLGAFLFGGEDIDKQVGILSGGERTRLALCQLLLSPSNLIILDEPTNHLDIQSKEVLKEALKHYEGTFIVVSHDREFLNNLTNRIWDIDNKHLKIYHDGVKDYLEHKKNKEAKQPIASKKEIQNEVKQNQTLANTAQADKELKKNQNKIRQKIEKIENEIAQLETSCKEMEAHLATVDYTKEEAPAQLLSEFANSKEKLAHLEKEWEEMVNELEKITV
jgi:ATP-binding cassette subfamily F protein 3